MRKLSRTLTCRDCAQWDRDCAFRHLAPGSFGSAFDLDFVRLYGPHARSNHAHAYAYGGCILQDMGYYPFSSRFFSDLTPYARIGDFIVALVPESQHLNEYAFALGALEHFAADTEGHRLATNPAVALLYPSCAGNSGT